MRKRIQENSYHNPNRKREFIRTTPRKTAHKDFHNSPSLLKTELFRNRILRDGEHFFPKLPGTPLRCPFKKAFHDSFGPRAASEGAEPGTGHRARQPPRSAQAAFPVVPPTRPRRSVSSADDKGSPSAQAAPPTPPPAPPPHLRPHGAAPPGPPPRPHLSVAVFPGEGGGRRGHGDPAHHAPDAGGERSPQPRGEARPIAMERARPMAAAAAAAA